MGGRAGFKGWFAAVVVGLIVAWSYVEFRSMYEREPIVPGPGVTRTTMLSEYFPSLNGSAGDTPVYLLEGTDPGGTVLVLGGTHPQEVSGLMAAILLIENATVAQGRLIVIPQANASGFTHTEPMEGFPHTFEIETPHGARWFRNGMRLTNPVHQWPDPEVYVHPASGERLIGHEIRNLNRVYPGRPDGTFTERVGYGITTLIRQEAVDLVIDLHEAYPEYPVINTIVAHQRALGIATIAQLMMQLEGVSIRVDPSPVSLRGLSHRELGDHTQAYALLTETANPAMGRFRGRTTEELVVEGKDDNYVRAAGMGRLFVPFDRDGHPLDVRVARQLLTVTELVNAYNDEAPDRPVHITGVPGYHEVIDRGIGAFLLPLPPVD